MFGYDLGNQMMEGILGVDRKEKTREKEREGKEETERREGQREREKF